MKRFIEGQDPGRGSLLPEQLDDHVAEDNPVRVVDVFVDELDLARLEREAQRNVELMCLTRRLAADYKTIANFRKDNGKAIRNVCRQFIVVCQQLDLFADAVVAIDGSKFKAVTSSDGSLRCALARATTKPWWPLPISMRARCGPCWPRKRITTPRHGNVTPCANIRYR